MGDKVRTEEQLLADWRAFQRLLAMTAPDHPSRPYLSEAVQHTERRYWRQVHLRRLADSGDVPLASSRADGPHTPQHLPVLNAISTRPTTGGS